MQKLREPILHRRRPELAHHGVPALAPLLDPHAESECDLPRHAVDVVRIDQQRRIKLLGRAGEGGENEDAGIERVLRGHVLLGDQIHAVVQRRDQADMRDAVETGERELGERLVQVADRQPIDLAVATIDLADQSGELGLSSR